jgi:hypothetical protein
MLLGGLTVVLSIAVANVFRNFANRDGQSFKLAHAIKWQLAGEAVIGLGTLAFAILAHFQLLPGVSILDQSMIRLVMFLATSVTTFHLWWIIRFINLK